MPEVRTRREATGAKPTHGTTPTGDAAVPVPPADTTRWVARRKAQVVIAVDAGLITLKEACRRYSLSKEEFASWKNALSTFGVGGLRVTRLKQYRLPPARAKGTHRAGE